MLRILFLCALMAQVAGCASQQMKILAESDSSLEIRKGETFAVQLPSVIGTGYRWELLSAPDETMLKLDKKEHRQEAKNADGSVGLDYFEFKTLRPGAVTLQFQLVRPWKQDKSEDPNARKKTFSIQITD